MSCGFCLCSGPVAPRFSFCTGTGRGSNTFIRATSCQDAARDHSSPKNPSEHICMLGFLFFHHLYLFSCFGWDCWWLLNTSALVNACLPTASPFILLSHKRSVYWKKETILSIQENIKGLIFVGVKTWCTCASKALKHDCELVSGQRKLWRDRDLASSVNDSNRTWNCCNTLWVFIFIQLYFSSGHIMWVRCTGIKCFALKQCRYWKFLWVCAFVS